MNEDPKEIRPGHLSALSNKSTYRINIGRRNLMIYWSPLGDWCVSPGEPGTPSAEWIIQHAQMWVKEIK